MSVDPGYAMTLTPGKAVAYFESKGYVFGFRWQDLADTAQASAFTVTRILKQDVLTDMKTALADSMCQGKTLTQFQDEVLPLLTRRSWLVKGLKASLGGELEGKNTALPAGDHFAN